MPATVHDADQQAVAVAPERVAPSPPSTSQPAPTKIVVAPERVAPSPASTSLAASSDPGRSVTRVAAPTVVVESAEGSGFDWGSAGIGAAIILGLALLAAGLTMVASRHDRLHLSH